MIRAAHCTGACALFVLTQLCLLPWARAHAGSDTLAKEIRNHLGNEIPEGLSDSLARLRNDETALNILHQKLSEGMIKQIPRPRHLSALELIATHLAWIAKTIPSCMTKEETVKITTIYESVLAILLGGVDSDSVARLLDILCAKTEFADNLRRIATIHHRLVGRLHIPVELSWELVTRIASTNPEAENVSQIVAVLDEIQRKNGSTTHAVKWALRRLDAGAKLRSVRNELRQQFLRNRGGI